MKNITDFALKAKYIFFLSVDDELAEIDAWIDRKFFRINFESIHFNKTVFWGRPGDEVIIMFKMLVLK